MKYVLLLILISFPAYAFNGSLFKEEVEGEYRICYYRDGVDVRVKSYYAANPCPNTLVED